jgi:hypothetical protein
MAWASAFERVESISLGSIAVVLKLGNTDPLICIAAIEDGLGHLDGNTTCLEVG